MNPIQWAKNNPLATGVIVVVGGVIFFVIATGGEGVGNDASAPVVVNAGPSDAMVQANAQLRMAELGITNNQIISNANVAISNTQASTSQLVSNNEKELGLASLNTQLRATEFNNAAAVSVASINANATTTAAAYATEARAAEAEYAYRTSESSARYAYETAARGIDGNVTLGLASAALQGRQSDNALTLGLNNNATTLSAAQIAADVSRYNIDANVTLGLDAGTTARQVSADTRALGENTNLTQQNIAYDATATQRYGIDATTTLGTLNSNNAFTLGMQQTNNAFTLGTQQTNNAFTLGMQQTNNNLTLGLDTNAVNDRIARDTNSTNLQITNSNNAVQRYNIDAYTNANVLANDTARLVSNNQLTLGLDTNAANITNVARLADSADWQTQVQRDIVAFQEDTARQQLNANVTMNSQNNSTARRSSNNNTIASVLGTVGSVVASFFSDARLKDNIVLQGQLPNGLNLYSYRFLPTGEYQLGVLAQEVEQRFPEMVSRHSTGALMVDYRVM